MAVPEDTRFSDIWGLNNPVMIGSGGDPKDIAIFVENCFTGNTLWPSGAAVVIDNDITFSLHQQNIQVDAQLTPEDSERSNGSFGSVSPRADRGCWSQCWSKLVMLYRSVALSVSLTRVTIAVRSRSTLRSSRT